MNLMGLTRKEYDLIVEQIGREPNETELALYSVMWSEHCAYKYSKKMLKLLPTKGERVIQGPGENAGILDIGDGQAIVMKVESHNHPSAVMPYEGAATGVGGILRDIFAMGARPIAVLDSLRFGYPDDEHTVRLISNIIKGIGDYGNCVGIPTVGGETSFNNSFKGNPLVNAMCVGIIDQKDIKKGAAKGRGNLVMLVGSTTGRDGIGGASFASEELERENEEKRSAVQVPDPFMEKLLLEACLELLKHDAIVGMQDMGAAGIVSSSSEMAARGNCGMILNLDRVPLREDGMSAAEILISESQERMLIIVEPEKRDIVEGIFAKWGLVSSVIGEVTDDGMYTVMYKGETVVSLPVKSLADGAPVYYREVKRPAYVDEVQNVEVAHTENIREVCEKVLSNLNISDKNWVYEQYDHMVRTDTVIPPGCDAALLRVKGSRKGIALSIDCNSLMCYIDPREGAKRAVAEAARNISCVGATPIGITDGLNFGNPEKDEAYWQFKEAIGGIVEACNILGIPVISGNVSFYNETEGVSVYPTPLIGMAGLIEDINKRMDAAFKDEGDIVVLLGRNEPELGGSEFMHSVMGIDGGALYPIDLRLEKRTQEFLRDLIACGIINAAHDVSDGGLFVTLVEMALLGNRGADIVLPEGDRVVQLFSEYPGRIVVTVKENMLCTLITMAEDREIETAVLGRVGGCALRFTGIDLAFSLERLRNLKRGNPPC